MTEVGRENRVVEHGDRYVVQWFAVIVVVLVIVMPPLALVLAAAAAFRASRTDDRVGAHIYIAILAISTLTTAGLVAGAAGDRSFMLAALAIALVAILSMIVRTGIAATASAWGHRNRAKA
jgi:hypothetical protein